jgi:PqqA peptide cyclase
MDTAVANPLALIAELTHRCPLRCVYCSNPKDLESRASELSAETWVRVFNEAAGLGVLQVDLTGGEPLARPDIVELVRAARSAGLYVNLITSGLPLDEIRLDSLVAAGLDHFQLSFQSAHPEMAAEISGTSTHAQKLQVLERLRGRRVAVTLNFVLHRKNLNEVPEMLAIAESSGASRVEFANVQYYGWAFANRMELMPTRDQVEQFLVTVKDAQERLRGKMRIEYVVPDYYAKFPKACMGGWGRKLMLITPSGDALPCHAARVIPGLVADNVKNRSLREIWQESPAFQRFRGEEWMQQPCRSCDRRNIDFAGCRCQAMLLANDARATDPVCVLTPSRQVIDEVLNEVPKAREPRSNTQHEKSEWLYRINPA